MTKLLKAAGWAIGGFLIGGLSLLSVVYVVMVLIEARGVAGVVARVALLAPLAFYFFAFRNLLRSTLSKRWPTAAGKVVSSGISTEKESSEEGGSYTTYKASVAYEYTVDGQRYFGNKIAFGYEGSPVLSYSRKITDRYPVGRAVTVRYDPRNPQRTVLETRTQWWPFIWRSGVAFFMLLLISGFSVSQ